MAKGASHDRSLRRASLYLYLLAMVCFLVLLIEAIRSNWPAVALAAPMTVFFVIIGRLVSPTGIARYRGRTR